MNAPLRAFLIVAIVAILLYGTGHTWVATVLLIGAGLVIDRWQAYLTSRAETQAATPTSTDSRLSSAEAQLAAVLAVVGQGVLVIDRDGSVQRINATAARLLHCPQPTTGPVRLTTLVPWPRLERAFADSLAAGAPRAFEDATPSALDRPLSVHLAPFGDPTQSRGVVVVLEDLSRLRQLEEHRRDFVANVSHELKTPLAAIQGFVETMLEDAAMPAETRQRFLERVAVQSERLATLVRDLLTLSRLDDAAAGAQAQEPVELAEVLRKVVDELAPLAEQKPVAVALELPDGPLPIAAEREALRQVFGNLVDNAIKYTPGGGSVRVLVRAGGDAEVQVVDTGIGLSPEDQERVFERFYRVDKARSRELGGTGLGLSIVKNTVRTLGGSVGVRSELGQGSTFWVRLPFARTA